MEGVCILLNKKYDWSAAKSLLLDLKGFIDSLLNYDKDAISENTLIKLRKHISKYIYLFYEILNN